MGSVMSQTIHILPSWYSGGFPVKTWESERENVAAADGREYVSRRLETTVVVIGRALISELGVVSSFWRALASSFSWVANIRNMKV